MKTNANFLTRQEDKRLC